MALKAYWKRDFLVLAAIFLLIAGLLFALHQHAKQRAFNLVAQRQALLTRQSAARLQDRLAEVAAALSLLAKSREWPTARGAAERHLQLLFHNAAAAGLAGFFLMDASGNLRIAHFPGEMTATGFPLHLLRPAGGGPSSLDTLSCDGERFLLLRQAADTDPEVVLVALVSLTRLVARSLQPVEKEADFAFLLDDDGRFQLHRRPDLVGRSLLTSPSGSVESLAYGSLAAFTRGQYLPPSGDWSEHPSFPVELLGGPRSPVAGTLLTGAPIQVAGARWTLALALPPAAMGDFGHGHDLFFIALAILLLTSLAVAFRAAGLLQQPRRLQAEGEVRQAEVARLRQALAQTERRYRNLLDNAGDAIFFIDPATGALLEVNRQAEGLLGYQAKEIHHLSLGVLFPGRNRQRYLRLVARVLRDGYGEESIVFRCKDGRLFTGAVHARLGDLEETQVVHGVLRDISELMRMEQELRQKNRDLTMMNEIADHAAASRDLKEMVYPILNKVVRGFGLDGGGMYIAEESGQLRLVAHHGISDDIRREIEVFTAGEGLIGRVAASGRSKTSLDLANDQRVCSEAVRRSGWRSLQAVPLTASDRPMGVLFLFGCSRRVLAKAEIGLLEAIGKQVGTAVAGANLLAALQRQVRLTQASNLDLEHSRRQLHDSLRRMEEANRALAQIDRMKNSFLALASHELRTPLTYILSGTELLNAQIRSRLQEGEVRVLDAVHEGGRRLQEIVEDLLEVARIESRTLYLSRERIDLHPLLTEVAEEFAPVLRERQLSFRLTGVPEALGLYGDAFHLRRTFRRLLENAVKFTPEGGWIEVGASLRTMADLLPLAERLRPFSPAFFAAPFPSRLLQLSIRDSGVGIDPEDQVRVFEKFYEIGDITGHSTSRTRFGGKGVGLGLTLVKGMVEAHGGMVWVDSAGTAPGGTGSAFHILLPLVEEEETSREIPDAGQSLCRHTAAG